MKGSLNSVKNIQTPQKTDYGTACKIFLIETEYKFIQNFDQNPFRLVLSSKKRPLKRTKNNIIA